MMRVLGVVRVGCSVILVYFGSRVIVCDVSIYDVSCVSKTFFAADGEKVVERCTIKNYTPYPSHYIYVQPFSCQRKQSKRCNTAQSLRGAGSGTQPPACTGKAVLAASASFAH